MEPTQTEFVQRAGAECVGKSSRDFLGVSRAEGAETRQRCAGERQGLSCTVVVFREQAPDLVVGAEVVVNLSDALIGLAYVKRAESETVVGRVGMRHKGIQQTRRDRIEVTNRDVPGGEQLSVGG